MERKTELLSFGETDVPASGYSVREPAPTESDLELVRQFRRLNPGHREAVREMVLSLLRIERRK